MAQGLRIIDMECNVPYGAEHEKSAAAAAAPPAGASKPAAEGTQPAGYGMANYGRIFRSRSEGNDPRPRTDLDAYVKHIAGLGIVALGAVRRLQSGDGRAAAPLPRPLPRPGPHQRHHAQGHGRRARAGAPGARRGLRRPRHLGPRRLPARERPPLLPALHQGRRARHPGAHLLVDELRQRPALRPGPPAPPRPGGDGLPGADHHRRPGRLAVGERDGGAGAAASEAPHGHLGPSRALPRPARLGLGDADAVRQHADPGQGAGRHLGRARGAAATRR